MKNLLNKVGFDIPITYLYDDNLGSLFWGSNSIQEKCSKHIDGKKNLADILTKNLGQVLFNCFCSSLGLEILSLSTYVSDT